MNRTATIGAMVAGGALTAYALVIRPWHLRWGATDAEVNEPLPGDEIVPRPSETNTHAITIHAPIHQV